MARRIAWLAVMLSLAAPAGCKKQQAQARPTPRTPAQATPQPDRSTHKAPVGRFPTGRNATDGNTQRVLSRLAEQGQRRERLVDGPWVGASVGQWTRYRTGGPSPMLLTRKVAAIDADTVTLEVTVGDGEEMVSTQQAPLRVPAGTGAGSIPPTAGWQRETVRVAGRSLPCRVATWGRIRRGVSSTYKVWLSDAVPGRLVRSGQIGRNAQFQLTMELVDFGG